MSSATFSFHIMALMNKQEKQELRRDATCGSNAQKNIMEEVCRDVSPHRAENISDVKAQQREATQV